MKIQGVKFIEQELDGKKISYTNNTEFLVQVGHGPKGKYETRWRVVGNLTEAVGLYNGLNVGRGYKKRLYVPNFNKPVLARQTS